MYITLNQNGQTLYLTANGDFQAKKTIDLDFDPKEAKKAASLALAKAQKSYDTWSKAEVIDKALDTPVFYASRKWQGQTEYLTANKSWSKSPLECVLTDSASDSIFTEAGGDKKRLMTGYGLVNKYLNEAFIIHPGGFDWLRGSEKTMSLSPDKTFLESFRKVMEETASQTLTAVKKATEMIFEDDDTPELEEETEPTNLEDAIMEDDKPAETDKTAEPAETDNESIEPVEEQWLDDFLTAVADLIKNAPKKEAFDKLIDQYKQDEENSLSKLDEAISDEETLLVAKALKDLHIKIKRIKAAEKLLEVLS